jgi:predicted transcriptional regulator
MADDKRERPRARLTEDIIREIRRRLRLGEFQHDIAADLGINQGRISEINTGKRGPSLQQGSLL